MKSPRFRAFGLIASATAFAVLGCGDPAPPPLAKVNGKVTYQGKPLTMGRVLFVPIAPKQDGSREYPAGGSIGEDGNYELTTIEKGDGAAIGEHKVVVMAMTGGAAPSGFYNGEAASKAKPAKLKSLIPEKYSSPDTTTLSYKVVAGANTFDIELTD